MYSANLLGNLHVMMGIDPHSFWPPGYPMPSGFAPHGCVTVLNGVGIPGQLSKTTTVDAMYHSIIHQASDIGNLIPHIQANLLLPLVIAFSGSKSQFGVSTVIAQDKPVGVACAMVVNMNMNCGEPVYVPFGVVPAMPMTCQAGFTVADLVGGLVSMAVDTAISGAMYLLGDEVLSPITDGLIDRFISKGVANSITRSIMDRGLKGLAAVTVTELPAALINNIVIGTPLGWSPPSLDNLTGMANWSENARNTAHNLSEKAVNAVNNYFSGGTDVL